MKTKGKQTAIKKARLERSLSQEELGEMMGGVTRQTVSKLERGIISPYNKDFSKLALALGKKEHELAGDREEYLQDRTPHILNLQREMDRLEEKLKLKEEEISQLNGIIENQKDLISSQEETILSLRKINAQLIKTTLGK